MAQILLSEQDLQEIIKAHVEKEYGKCVSSVSFASSTNGSDTTKVRSVCVTLDGQTRGWSNSAGDR